MLTRMLLAALLASGAAAEPAQTVNELEGVRQAIRTRRARWAARETAMSRLSRQERRKRLGALRAPAGQLPQRAPAELPLLSGGATLDWRNNGGLNVVTPIKDQGACGSCWAFSTTAGLESQILMAGGQLPDASEQTLVSCSGAGSCSGGYPTRASGYITSRGLPPESRFPYTGTDSSCRLPPRTQNNTAKLGGFWTVPADVGAIKAALAAYGPLPTTFNVYSDFYSYSSGVYSYTTGEFEGRHAVLIIGYDDAAQAFIVKNSWGTWWGEEGYFRVAYSEVNSPMGFGVETLAYSMGCIYTLSPPVAIMSQRGGYSQFTVQASGPACPGWRVTADERWIQITRGQRGRKKGTVQFRVLPGGNRSSHITVRAESAAGRSARFTTDEELIVPGASRLKVIQEETPPTEELEPDPPAPN